MFSDQHLNPTPWWGERGSTWNFEASETYIIPEFQQKAI